MDEITSQIPASTRESFKAAVLAALVSIDTTGNSLLIVASKKDGAMFFEVAINGLNLDGKYGWLWVENDTFTRTGDNAADVEYIANTELADAVAELEFEMRGN